MQGQRLRMWAARYNHGRLPYVTVPYRYRASKIGPQPEHRVVLQCALWNRICPFFYRLKDIQPSPFA
jgi:hypothetical protein